MDPHGRAVPIESGGAVVDGLQDPIKAPPWYVRQACVWVWAEEEYAPNRADAVADQILRVIAGTHVVPDGLVVVEGAPVLAVSVHLLAHAGQVVVRALLRDAPTLVKCRERGLPQYDALR